MRTTRAAIGRHPGVPSRKGAPNFYDPRAPHNQPFINPNRLSGSPEAQEELMNHLRAEKLRRHGAQGVKRPLPRRGFSRWQDAAV